MAAAYSCFLLAALLCFCLLFNHYYWFLYSATTIYQELKKVGTGELSEHFQNPRQRA